MRRFLQNTTYLGAAKGVLSLLLVCSSPLAKAKAGPERIKVIGAGLGRTGTDRLRMALDTLGYKTYHHGALTDAEHHGLWEKVYASKGACSKTAWEAIDAIGQEGYNATSGFPASLLYKEILEHYPDALVILGVLDSPDEFAEKYQNTLGTLLAYLTKPPFKTIVPWVSDFLDFLQARTGIAVTPQHFPVQSSLAAAYTSWLKEVQASVPKDQLLLHNQKEGWAPLCKFLGKHLHRGTEVGHEGCPVTVYPLSDSKIPWEFLVKFAQVVTFHWPYPLYALVIALSLLTLTAYALCTGLFRRQGKSKKE